MSAPEEEQEELNVLFHAVQLGRTDIVKNAVSSLRETKSAEELLEILSAVRPEDGSTLLHIGAAAGHSDIIRALLNTGVDAAVVPTRGDYVGKTAYQAADPAVHQAFHVFLFEKIALGQEKVIENLLDSGIAVDLRDSSTIDDSTLHWACSFGNASVASTLLARGCPVNILNSSKQAPLHLACKNGSREVVDLLLAHGANALLSDDQGRVASDMVPPKHKELIEVVDAHIAEHPAQHAAGEDGSQHSSARPEKSESAPASEDGRSARDPLGTEQVRTRGGSFLSQRPLSNVTSHLILWPPPQRQRMLPMSVFEDNAAEGGGPAPEYGIVFSSMRPILISCSAEYKSDSDVGCIPDVCGLTQALRRFGLESVVLRSPASADIRFSVNSSLCAGHNRYSINVCPSFISVIASDREGLLYGAYTLVQIVQLHSEFGVIESDAASLDHSGQGLEFDMNGFNVSNSRKAPDVIRTLTVPCVSVEDWPDFPGRGVTWCYDSAALTNMSVLHNMIAMLSRMRMNKLFLNVDCLDYSSSSEYSEVAFTARQKENILSGSRIYYIERLCRSYFIDVVPIVRVPCFDYEPGGPSHKRLNVDALRCFASALIHVEFVLELRGGSNSQEESGNALVARSCRLALKSIRAAGFSSVVVKCSSDFQRLYDPLSIATHIGLLGVYGDIDSSIEEEAQHALSSQLFVREAELRCRVDLEQGKTLSLAPGFQDSTILCPLVFVKYKCFLHAGFAWNRDTVLDIIAFSSDIQMLEEVINLTLFTEGNGSLLTAVPSLMTESDQHSQSEGRDDSLRRNGSSGGLHGLDGEKEKEASSGFYFWRKQISSDSAVGSSPAPLPAATMTHSEFVMSLLTCRGELVEQARAAEGAAAATRPIFEYSDSPRHATPLYKKSPPLRAGRPQPETPSRQRPKAHVADFSTFADSESIFWRYLNAKTYEDFVTCGYTRTCERTSDGAVDGFAPSKAQALEVLKYYRRALSSVGWKLDRKKMAALRESGMSSEVLGTRAQWGAEAIKSKNVRGKDESAEVFVFENPSSGEAGMPFPSYREAKAWDGEPRAAGEEPRRSVSSFPSSPGMDVAGLQLEIEEIYVVLHLICTVCRAVILGYNACEKSTVNMPEGGLLKFSELASLLPTGSTSDIANALLEGIEYGMLLWNRRFERLSFTVMRGKNSSRATAVRSVPTSGSEGGPAVPGIGAFYWVSQNLPQQVEDLFFNTLTMLQRNND